MEITILLIRYGLISTFVVLASLPSVAQTENHTDYTMTISGGVSLGVYEAGQTWVLLRFLRAHSASLRKSECESLGQRADCTEADGVLGRRLNLMGEKTTDLVAMSGGSAGGVNSLLGAVAWCSRDKTAMTAENNPFRNLWINTAWANMYPFSVQANTSLDLDLNWFNGASSDASPVGCESEQGQCAERTDKMSTRPDALLSRGGVRLAADALLQSANRKANFIPGCELPIAVSLMNSESLKTRIGDKGGNGQAAFADTGRVVAAWRVGTDDRGRLEQKELFILAPNRANDDQEEKNNELFESLGVAFEPKFSPGIEGLSEMMPFAEASSAVPLAFGPVQLDLSPERVRRKTESLDGVDAIFAVDGGVFDNVPLGVSTFLASISSRSGADEPEHMYLIPDFPIANISTGARASIGLQGILDFVPVFIDVARDYELQLVRRLASVKRASQRELIDRVCPSCAPGRCATGPGCHRGVELNSNPRLWVVDRHSNIFGSELELFASFLSPLFREYDYAVGIVDGEVALAERLSGVPAGTGLHDKSVRKAVVQIHRDLLHLDGDIDYVSRMVLSWKARAAKVRGDDVFADFLNLDEKQLDDPRMAPLLESMRDAEDRKELAESELTLVEGVKEFSRKLTDVGGSLVPGTCLTLGDCLKNPIACEGELVKPPLNRFSCSQADRTTLRSLLEIANSDLRFNVRTRRYRKLLNVSGGIDLERKMRQALVCQNEVDNIVSADMFLEPDRWMFRSAFLLVERLGDIEIVQRREGETRPAWPPLDVYAGTVLAQYALETVNDYTSNNNGLFIPGSIGVPHTMTPRRWLLLMPSSIGIDMGAQEVNAVFRPLALKVSLFEVSPVLDTSVGFTSAVEPEQSFTGMVSLGLRTEVPLAIFLGPVIGLVLSSVDITGSLGGRATATSFGPRLWAAPVFEVGAHIFARKARVGVGFEIPMLDAYFGGDLIPMQMQPQSTQVFHLKLQLSDFNGFAYWVGRWLNG